MFFDSKPIKIGFQTKNAVKTDQKQIIHVMKLKN